MDINPINTVYPGFSPIWYSHRRASQFPYKGIGGHYVEMVKQDNLFFKELNLRPCFTAFF